MGFKRKERGKSLKLLLIVLLCIIIFGSGGWLIWTKFEGRGPEIRLDLEKQILGETTQLSGTVRDPRSGVRKLWAGLIQDGEETVLLEKTFAKAGSRSEPPETPVPFDISIDAQKLDLADGKAVLRMVAWDDSWRDWGKGNRTYIEKEVVFDTQPPGLAVLTRQHNVSQGGSGLVIYRLSEDCEKSGVYVGDEFFPGYSGYFDDEAIHLALFALRYDQGKDTRLYVKAVDAAGNASQSGFYNYIREKQFKKDVLRISDRFLERKMPEFASSVDELNDASLLDQFLHVNQVLRKKNNQRILSAGRETEKSLYWKGAFGRLPNSARRANFADHRVYQHNGEVIDRAVHMGIDLASVQHARIPAANAGRVAFAGELGIYGNTVLIDHGYGLFSVYSHLSRLDVDTGDMVAKDEIIGNTGTSGLAGGDHLHFGMFIDHVYVDPTEWWDAAWIKNNITGKLQEVRSLDE